MHSVSEKYAIYMCENVECACIATVHGHQWFMDYHNTIVNECSSCNA